MANLSTLDGISDARNELYQKLESGTVDEKRAAQMERVLRGQTELKGTLPIRFVALLKNMKGTTAEPYLVPLLSGLLKFTTGEGMPVALEPKNKA